MLLIRQGRIQDKFQLTKMRFDFSMENKVTTPDLYQSFYEECNLFFEDMFESKRWVVWVAEIEGEIVSHVFIEIIDTVPRPGRKKSPFGYVTNVYTVPEYRSQGIGGKILDEVNNWAKENGLTFLMVWPSETSVQFYERYGFRSAEEMMENHLKHNVVVRKGSFSCQVKPSMNFLVSSLISRA
ncbi:GNAT family N-acetyltransferase [Paenibacillus sp. LHD-117]|uniref:GNAT family N-acetyltransferase n=1 Tax=Paenibacillus sp. LHD-117 TaxID=3071412 RepID=UPI0027E0F630|nr:GNAT family N-acetyltransferase [Paenibacillus sp. LHD-117]MDQ6421771.1 GNAT family N-acetyltransferase [Paenibacillus sp. LHD-117]